MPTTDVRLDVRKTYKMLIGGKFVRTESGRAQRGGEQDEINFPRGSRKDLREAVVAARTAFDSWSSATAMLRGQILYRTAEMLDARRAEFGALLGGGRAAHREVDDSVDALVWYAGWTDKLSQVMGTVNAVAAPYFTFTLPEPTGVVAVIAPGEPALLGCVTRLAAVLCGGNTCVLLASEDNPRPALTLGEVIATSDIPSGVVNILCGQHREIIPWMAGHMDINAIDISGCSEQQRADVEVAATGNLKRVVQLQARTLDAVAACLEMKTVWHPTGR